MTEIAGAPVFVKAIRLTDRDVDAGPGDTRNLFGVPPWYQYGVGEGSTGVNAWREIAALEMVGAWADGDHANPFPLLYHWRVLDDITPRSIDEAGIGRAVSFWSGSVEVEARLRALSAATSVVVVFIEFVPAVLRDWLPLQLAVDAARAEHALATVEEQLLGAATQMRAHGAVHFDAHLDNVLMAGDRLVVADFGLFLAPEFTLDDGERQFLTTHVDHDVGYCAAELVNAMCRQFIGFANAAARNEWIRTCARTGLVDGIPRALGETVRRLAPTAAVMNDVYWRLHAGDVSAPFPADALAATLAAAGLSRK